MRVMLSAAGSAVAPSIIRHLQSLGHYVIGHDCSPYGASSGCNLFLQSPHVGGLYLTRFGEFIIDNAVDLYLPFLDEEIALICGFTRPVLCSPSETVSIFTSKISQQRAMELGGLPVAPGVPAPMLKPEHGRGGRGVFPLPDGYLAQQRIEGDEYTVDVLTGMDGAFLFAVPRLRIQANGVSVIGKIVMDAEIIDLARLVVSKFAFRGPINIQIIREHETGKLYIIELNPRLSGSCIFTVMAGFDILDATIRLCEGKPFVAPDKIEDGLVIRRHYVEQRL